MRKEAAQPPVFQQILQPLGRLAQMGMTIYPAQVVLVADRQKLPMLLLAALVDPPAVAVVVVALR
jgi:hypothetical protein